jgi:hypothetical protein
MLLEELMPDIPQLIEAGELEVRDISGENRPNANFAVVHRDRIIKDGFVTSTAARLFIHRCLIAPAQVDAQARGHRRSVHDPRQCWAEVLVAALKMVLI